MTFKPLANFRECELRQVNTNQISQISSQKITNILVCIDGKYIYIWHRLQINKQLNSLISSADCEGAFGDSYTAMCTRIYSHQFAHVMAQLRKRYAVLNIQYTKQCSGFKILLSDSNWFVLSTFT